MSSVVRLSPMRETAERFALRNSLSLMKHIDHIVEPRRIQARIDDPEDVVHDELIELRRSLEEPETARTVV